MRLCRVLRHGTYLAQRWDDESGVNLYHCEGEDRSFVSSVPLEDYTQGV